MPDTEDLLDGAIDMHVHPLVDGTFSVPLTMDAVDDMREAGMAGVLLKPHFNATPLMAAAIDETVPDFRAFGGLIMERSAGGIDPYVVKNAIADGARKVWMPLMTQNFVDRQLSHPDGYFDRDDIPRMEAQHGPFWSYLNDDGEIREGIRSDLREVLGLIADADVVFDTGHASAEESMVLVEEASRAGVDKIVVDHPLAITKQATIDQQVEMAEMGAYMEQSWAKMQPSGGDVSAERYAEAIEAVGAERTVMVTDYAGDPHPWPSEAMRDYVETMLAHGISAREIELMIHENPRALLDL